jgi:hypothetical protein
VANQIAIIFGDFCKIILVQGLLVLKFSINLAETKLYLSLVLGYLTIDPSDY